MSVPGIGTLSHDVGRGQWNDDRFDITVRQVYRGCNSGWMSELETASQSALIAPIRRESTTLSPQDQRRIGIWA